MNRPLAPFATEAPVGWLTLATDVMAARLGAHLALRPDPALRAAAERLPKQAAEPGLPMGPVARLVAALHLSAIELDLFVLAGLAEEHPDCAAAFALLSPSGRPWPTLALAEALLGGPARRGALRAAATAGALATAGAVTLGRDAPTPLADLALLPGLWTLAGTGAALLPPLETAPDAAPVAGLAAWLADEETRLACDCMRRRRPVSIVVTGASAETARHRALALGRHASAPALSVTGPATPASLRAALLQGVLTDRPVCLTLEDATSLVLPDAPPVPVVIACPEIAPPLAGAGPVLHLHAAPLAPRDHVTMWQALAPGLAPETARAVAQRYPVEPYRARQALDDLAFRHGPEAPIDAAGLARVFRARGGARLPAGVTRVSPRAGWAELILPEPQLAQLTDAARRIEAQPRVLDDWALRGARGVRVLLSGPPGTGKTLAAEVLAGALGTDLLVADLGQILSKWVGETEKNLARLFDEAESMRAVLFFDEAEALFGKRTEVNDAQDRFANLETAYLLNRLDRYDGLAVLATNFRRAIDAAFIRRLDHIVELREPSAADRARLWRAHLPPEAPVAPDVDLDRLAQLYPMVGGEIRNACLSAAYLAAHEGRAIGLAHLAHAIRTEFDKAGRPFREVSHA